MPIIVTQDAVANGFNETFDGFFADFATEVAIAGGATVLGIFDNAYQGAFNGLVPDTGPQVVCQYLDVSGVTVGTQLTIKSVVYTVTALEPDGTGMTVLKLKA